MAAAKSKYIRSTSPVGRDFPTLQPPLRLEPDEVVRVARDLDLPETEPATAADYTGPDGLIHAEPGPVDPDLRPVREVDLGTDAALAFPPDSLVIDVPTAAPDTAAQRAQDAYDALTDDDKQLLASLTPSQLDELQALVIAD
jgi:hypothetical protein